jgi:hypothetical protein
LSLLLAVGAGAVAAISIEEFPDDISQANLCVSP